MASKLRVESPRAIWDSLNGGDQASLSFEAHITGIDSLLLFRKLCATGTEQPRAVLEPYTQWLRFAGLFVLLGAVLAPMQSRAAQPGSLDPGFNPAINAGGVVYAVTIQTNGQILIGGAFNSIGGVRVTNVARLNSDGTLDATFDPGNAADSGYVNALAVQNDGKVLIGGYFASSSLSKPAILARLNPDGTADKNFYRYLYLDAAVNAVLVQNDGKILFGGAFVYAGGYSRRSIARINADGTLDTSFDACVASSSGAGATSLALLSDGRILASGKFGFSTGYYRDGIARLGLCGELDPSYAPPPGVESNATAYAIALLAGGEAFLTGNFTSFYNQSQGGIVLLTTNGIPDGNFNPGSGVNAGETIYTLAIQSDGKIIVGGEFTQYNGQARVRLARLNRDGNLDTLFNAGSGPNNSVSSFAIQPDRKIVVVGKFSSFNGAARTGIARVYGGPVPFWLSALSPSTNGGVQMSFYGEDQAAYSVQASSDLVNWVSFTNVIGATNPISITDPEANLRAQRFYRAVYLP